MLDETVSLEWAVGDPEVGQKRGSGKLAVESHFGAASMVAQKPFLPVGRK